MAAGRQVTRIQLYKPEGGSLGFSVVGLRSEHQGELGIYVQEIQPEGIAGTSALFPSFYYLITATC
jgi:multiple PDZ domain protein